MRFPARPSDLRGSAIRQAVNRRSEQEGADAGGGAAGGESDGAGGAGTEVQTVSVDDLSTRDAEITRLREHNARLTGDIAKTREKKGKDKAAAEEALRANGEFKQLVTHQDETIAALRERVQELESAGPRLERLDAREAAAADKVEKGLEGLDDEQRAIVSRMSDVFDQLDTIATLKRSATQSDTPAKGSTTTKDDPTSADGPGATGTKTWSTMTDEEKRATRNGHNPHTPRSALGAAFASRR